MKRHKNIRTGFVPTQKSIISKAIHGFFVKRWEWVNATSETFFVETSASLVFRFFFSLVSLIFFHIIYHLSLKLSIHFTYSFTSYMRKMVERKNFYFTGPLNIWISFEQGKIYKKTVFFSIILVFFIFYLFYFLWFCSSVSIFCPSFLFYLYIIYLFLF
jgi:hypothetical protein